MYENTEINDVAYTLNYHTVPSIENSLVLINLRINLGFKARSTFAGKMEFDYVYWYLGYSCVQGEIDLIVFPD